MIELLETNKIDGLVEYTANNLDDFLTREGDKELMSRIIDSLRTK